jgi:hypothetical protein
MKIKTQWAEMWNDKESIWKFCVPRTGYIGRAYSIRHNCMWPLCTDVKTRWALSETVRILSSAPFPVIQTERTITYDNTVKRIMQRQKMSTKLIFNMCTSSSIPFLVIQTGHTEYFILVAGFFFTVHVRTWHNRPNYTNFEPLPFDRARLFPPVIIFTVLHYAFTFPAA